MKRIGPIEITKCHKFCQAMARILDWVIELYILEMCEHIQSLNVGISGINTYGKRWPHRNLQMPQLLPGHVPNTVLDFWAPEQTDVLLHLLCIMVTAIELYVLEMCEHIQRLKVEISGINKYDKNWPHRNLQMPQVFARPWPNNVLDFWAPWTNRCAIAPLVHDVLSHRTLCVGNVWAYAAFEGCKAVSQILYWTFEHL